MGRIVATLFTVAFAFVAIAQDTATSQQQEFPSASGNAYLRLCSIIEKGSRIHTRKSETPSLASLFTDGVVNGVYVEMSFSKEKTGKEAPSPFCIPTSVENGQLVRSVLKYIRERPEEAHIPSGVLIVRALRHAFPCS